jgi:hypothetical protein
MTPEMFIANLFRLMSQGISASEAQRIIEEKYGKVKLPKA